MNILIQIKKIINKEKEVKNKNLKIIKVINIYNIIY